MRGDMRATLSWCNHSPSCLQACEPRLGYHGPLLGSGCGSVYNTGVLSSHDQEKRRDPLLEAAALWLVSSFTPAQASDRIAPSRFSYALTFTNFIDPSQGTAEAHIVRIL